MPRVSLAVPPRGNASVHSWDVATRSRGARCVLRCSWKSRHQNNSSSSRNGWTRPQAQGSVNCTTRVRAHGVSGADSNAGLPNAIARTAARCTRCLPPVSQQVHCASIQQNVASEGLRGKFDSRVRWRCMTAEWRMKCFRVKACKN
jgi:hypothetical protein